MHNTTNKFKAGPRGSLANGWDYADPVAHAAYKKTQRAAHKAVRDALAKGLLLQRTVVS